MYREIDGKFFRMRRGKLVEIPREWLHRVPSNQTMLQRKVGKIEIKKGRKKCYKWKRDVASSEIG